MWREDHLHGDLFSSVPKLGNGLLSTLPESVYQPPPLSDVGDDPDHDCSFILSEKQRQLLKTGRVENKSTRNDSTLEKRDRIPQRIQHLSNDIALLAHASYFSDEKWEDGDIERHLSQLRTAEQLEAQDNPDSLNIEMEKSGPEHYVTPFESAKDLWEELLDTPRPTQQVRDDIFFHGHAVRSKEIQLGFEIGNSLRMLRPDDYDPVKYWDSSEEVIGEGLMWGFLLAFIGESQSNLDKEEEQLNDLFEVFVDLLELRKKEAERQPTMAEIHDAQFEDVTKEGVKEAGFTPHPIVIREVEYHRKKFDRAKTKDDLPDVLSQEQKESFWENHGDEQSELDPALKQKISKRIVKEINEVSPLKQVETLRETLEEDIETVHERGTMGIDTVYPVLRGVWEIYNNNSDEQKLTSGNVGQIIDEKASPVSANLNRISNHDDSKKWSSEDIVIRNDSKERGTNWTLTDYGKLLCYILFDSDEETDWLYYFAVGPEELSMYERKLVLNALDDLNLFE